MPKTKLTKKRVAPKYIKRGKNNSLMPVGRKPVSISKELREQQAAMGSARRRAIQAILARTAAARKKINELCRGADMSSLKGIPKVKFGKPRTTGTWRVSPTKAELDAHMIDHEIDNAFDTSAVAVGKDPPVSTRPPMKPPIPREQWNRRSETLAAIELNYIRDMLEKCNGSVRWAAKRLGIERTTLQRKIRRLEDFDLEVQRMRDAAKAQKSESCVDGEAGSDLNRSYSSVAAEDREHEVRMPIGQAGA